MEFIRKTKGTPPLSGLYLRWLFYFGVTYFFFFFFLVATFENQINVYTILLAAY